MPLLDHFHPPLKDERHWEATHSAWANVIVVQLNDSLLPADYFAEPHVKLGVPVEIDVATLERDRIEAAEQDGGVAIAVYAPPTPALTFPVDFSDLDTFEIQVRQDGGLTLVAAIELISPANKDRPTHRQAFVRKCASYLQEGIGVIIVDIVTNRLANLHAELVGVMAPTVATDLSEEGALYAVAYRSQPANQIEVWPQRLEVGKGLPTLPLWLTDILAVPVDLERSYLAACKALRIRVA